MPPQLHYAAGRTMISAAVPGLDPRDVEAFTKAGYWRTDSLGDIIYRHAQDNPAGTAFIEGDERLTWADYERRSSEIAGLIIDAGARRGELVGVMLPDAPLVHIIFQAAEKAGVTVVGIGARAGEREIGHLLSKAKATAFITEATHRGQNMAALVGRLRRDGVSITKHIVVAPDSRRPVDDELQEHIRRRKLGPNDLWLLNTTSGTTGLPKQVMQFQNRWFTFHQLAAEAGALTSNDVFMSIIPAPFGFGLWTAHFTPSILGAPTVLMSRYETEGALDLIERERVTVLMCVSTQFIMMLNSPSSRKRDLSSLRVMFTGGEAIPYERAAEFEDRVGARVLQFYGSNETGALSYTT
ncbi:MAG: acyl--CoA ligase, partial [Chloroflexota bacterium]|nr:acyl--CoA ligase [Chloroflexota bacterium]